ncbi:GGDEF domain-containing protein [Desulfosporosinus sp. BG]|uniref:GGDEF domain-containing protein n=1 Tax=Desulfosporosinus sp. BG TaxID=1633135 RepID=UPI000855FF2D|nr:GGDEF domain-containing protein [Desulfosporosinus sp. BG]ODA41877.1 diguanylate cyclase/phosphodiesterase (GGDEF & EAL domains) with PAS/PAC sensor(s) [Desulfosporosinus sp. BG]
MYYKYIIAGVTIIILEGFLIALLVLSNSAKRRAEDSLRLLNTQLEQKVVERTQQLEESNAALDKEIYERTMAQQELIASNDELEAVNYQIKRANDELKRMSLTDKLTGAWNRRHFEKEAAIEIERSERYKEVCSLIVMDIDHFKKINDQYGHLVGDAVLSELAKLLQNNLRKVDSLTRWGGEEFIVLAKHTGGSSAMEMAEKLRHLVETYDFPEVGEMTVSIGVAEFKSGKTLDNWIKVADDALYEAKRLGRNRIQLGNH